MLFFEIVDRLKMSFAKHFSLRVDNGGKLFHQKVSGCLWINVLFGQVFQDTIGHQGDKGYQGQTPDPFVDVQKHWPDLDL